MKSLINPDIEDFLTFDQSVSEGGTIYGFCIIKKINIYDNQ